VPNETPEERLRGHFERVGDYEWQHKYPEFRDTIEQLLIIQADRLINKGLSGAYNVTITKLLLNVNHGYRETVHAQIAPRDLDRYIQFVSSLNPNFPLGRITAPARA